MAVLELLRIRSTTSPSSSSAIRLCKSSSISKQNIFKITHQIRFHKPLQKSRITTYNSIIYKQQSEEDDEEEQELLSSTGLNFVRGKKLLSEISTWGIGGPCNYFLRVSDETHLISAIDYCHRCSIPVLIIGRGSNCLFDDSGFHGCVILNRVESFEVIGHGFYKVGSGYPINRLGVECSNEGFSGLEFAGGVPGTVGGAVYMNAGANGQETSDVVYSVDIVTHEGEFKTLYRNDLRFGYRTSSLQTMEDLAAITGVTFQLRNSVSAKEMQQEYLARRRLSQPVGERCAGSVFKNPSGLGVSAGELIEKAGMKGFRVGGAKVSDIHANFFINCGGSTCKDMLELIERVKEEVDHKFGIQLEEEIRYFRP